MRPADKSNLCLGFDHSIAGIVTVVTLWLMCAGCSTPSSLAHHTLAIDKKGNPQLYDAHGRQEMDDLLFDDYLESMMNSMRTLAPANPPGSTNRELVVFIHGGMNKQSGSDDRVARLAPEMMKNGVYPLFINWNSSLWSCYADHLLWVRRGNADYAGLAPAVTPFYLAADLGGAVLKSPIVFLEGFWRTAEALPYAVFQNEAQDGAIRSAHKLMALYAAAATRTNAIAIEVGTNRLSMWGQHKQSALTLLNTPARAVVAPFFHAIGTPAWNMMLRRVDLMFESEEDSHRGYGMAVPARGVIPRFARKLSRFVAEEAQQGRSWKLTVVGHSMGCIVTTELLERAMMRDSGFPVINNLVLMAPAGSQRDFEHAVIPYLKKNTNTVCSVMVLEMRAELWERYLRRISPQGSLLVWIDDYFSTPNSEVDHTLGRFTNLMLAAHRIPEDVRARIQFRTFPYPSVSPALDPQKHGDFSTAPFWRPDFWDVRKSRP